MKQTKKMVSLCLSLVFLAISMCMPLSVGAEGTYTTEAGGTLTRLIPTTKSFEANETKTFDFTVDTTAEYALFMDSTDSNKVGTATTFAITEKDTGTAVPFKVREKETDAKTMISVESYSYVHPSRYGNTEGFQYERVGNISELKATLTAGTNYTLSVSREATLSSLNYVDLRCLTIPITGGKQAIASEDASVFSTTTAAHVNEQLNYGNTALPEGYSLIGDYTDKSVFASSNRNVPRYIHISKDTYAEYKLDIQKEGWYRVYYNTSTWVDTKTVKAGDKYSFKVPFSVDGEEKETLVWSFTATADGQSPETRLLKTLPVKFNKGEHTIKFGNATAGSYAYHILMEELPDYDPEEDATVVMDTVPVKVDSTLSRFEPETPITLSSTGKSYVFTFTPEATGEYAFFYNNAGPAKNQPMTISVSEAGGEKIFENTCNTKEYVFERFGDNSYQAAPMEAGKTYTITLSGTGTAITMEYFDLRCVNPLITPAEGKFSISPSDYVVTSIGGSHMSQQFNGTDKNADYPMIGDYFSTKLQSPRAGTTKVHIGNGAYITYALNVTTPGYYTLTLPNVTTYPGAVSAESIRLSVNGETYDEQGWTSESANKDLTFKPFYLYEGVNRITLTNLTVPNTGTEGNPNGSDVGSDLRMLLFDQQAGKPEPTAISGDTKVDSKIPLNSMETSTGSVTRNDADGSYSFKAGASVEYKVNVNEAGTYVVYIDGKAPQNGVDVLVDGTSKLGATYKTTGQKETVNASFSSRQVKKLSVPVELEAGEHTITLNFANGSKWDETENKAVDITEADDYTMVVYSAWMRRVDLTASVSEEMFLRSWDFTAVSFLQEDKGSSSSAGWCFPHQYTQGGPFTVGSFTDCRSVVFINNVDATYKVNIPADGYYNFSTFINCSAATNTCTMKLNGETFTCDVTTDGSGPVKSTFEPVFLTAGAYDVNFKAPASPTGTMRLYGMSVAAKEMGDYVAVSADSASVSVAFDKTYTGSVITAFYSASNELVGIQTGEITEAASYRADIALTGTPVTAKVFVWGDLTNVVPLRTSIDFAAGTDSWIVK